MPIFDQDFVLIIGKAIKKATKNKKLTSITACRYKGKSLIKGNILGQKIFVRGMPETLQVNSEIKYSASLFDLLQAYGKIQRRKDFSEYKPVPFDLMSGEEAMVLLSKMLGNLPVSTINKNQSVWATLESFLPDRPDIIDNPIYTRSSFASMFTAGLEMVKQGQADVRQDGSFRPVYIRSSIRI
jgi:segregation and condensation protein A